MQRSRLVGESANMVGVSILIRPEGRMQRPSFRLRPPGSVCWCFNPHPARRPDATNGAFNSFSCSSAAVSILIRPEGRMQLCPATVRRPWVSCFNPHPARRPDATGRAATTAPPLLFQSSSGQKAGCNPGLLLVVACFNPHPARRPDATSQRPLALHGLAVSILIRPEGRMQRR